MRMVPPPFLLAAIATTPSAFAFAPFVPFHPASSTMTMARTSSSSTSLRSVNDYFASLQRQQDTAPETYATPASPASSSLAPAAPFAAGATPLRERLVDVDSSGGRLTCVDDLFPGTEAFVRRASANEGSGRRAIGGSSPVDETARWSVRAPADGLARHARGGPPVDDPAPGSVEAFQGRTLGGGVRHSSWAATKAVLPLSSSAPPTSSGGLSTVGDYFSSLSGGADISELPKRGAQVGVTERKALPASKVATSAVDSYFASFQPAVPEVPPPFPTQQAAPSPVAAPDAVVRRRTILAGNWKLNPPTRSEAVDLLKLLAANCLNHRDGGSIDGPEMIVFPPLPYLSDAVAILRGTGVQVGAQTTGPVHSGAHTGEVAPSMILTSGCSHVLLGHSERRTLYGESDADVNARVLAALSQPSDDGNGPGLTVILCVGETLEEYEAGLLDSVVDTQIRKGLAGVPASYLLSGRIVLAYEPVWAIGTGIVATPAQAQVAHASIRQKLSSMYGVSGEKVAAAVRIQYGGSVSPESIESLIAEPDVDGALVGGASLSADSFVRIYDGLVATGGEREGYAQPHEMNAVEILPTKNALGESPVWSDRDQCLYWVSATEGEVWTWNLHDPPHRMNIESAVGCVVLAASAARNAGSVIAAAEDGIFATSMVDQTKELLVDRPDVGTPTRPNDGRVDRYGNLVLGMYNKYHRAGPSAGENNAGLFRLRADTLQFEEILTEYRFRVSNCICFSGDGKTMYFGDTPTRKVYAFDYDPNGPLTNRRLVWTIPSDIPGGPDGAQVDSEGMLWIAVTGAGRVVRLDPLTGVVDAVVRVGGNPTSVTFGGPNLDDMFVTTRAPDGGGLWHAKMPHGICGVSEPEFGSVGPLSV